MWRVRLGGLVVAAVGLMAQTPPQFEVAVVRPTAAGASAGTSFEVFEGGRIRISNEPVKLLVRVAFRLQDSQIAGGPAWIESDRYDVEAKTGRPEKPGPDEIGPMMRSLLRERFHFQFHSEQREGTTYSLVVANGGPKLATSQDGEAGGMNTRNSKGITTSVATATSMELLATYIGNRLGRIVTNETGLTGKYDFSLN